MMALKRVYEEAQTSDGFRILVDRLWPRGLSKERARIDLWLKDITPSDGLRRWYAHDPAKWVEFKRRYLAELRPKTELLDVIRQKAEQGIVTLLYSAKNREINNAVALCEFLEATSKVHTKS